MPWIKIKATIKSNVISVCIWETQNINEEKSSSTVTYAIIEHLKVWFLPSNQLVAVADMGTKSTNLASKGSGGSKSDSAKCCRS
jgi:hypothetical protein